MAIIGSIPGSVNPNTRLKGMDIVLAKLNREILKIEDASTRGLLMCAALIRRDTEKTNPLTPVDLGNLRASWFVTTAKAVTTGKERKFKGPKSGEMISDHSETINEAQGLARGLENSKKKKVVIIGYSANYALFVHEAIFGKVKKIDADFKRPGSGPKWFEASFKRNAPKMLQIIQDTSKIRK